MHTISRGSGLSMVEKNKGIRILFSIFLLVWCLGFLSPVITPEFEGKTLISYIAGYNYSLVCHQSDSANITIGGSHLLVCARCTGLYSGALLSVIILLFCSFNINLSLKPLVLLSAPLIFDAISVRISLYSYSKTIAFITGMLCGAIVIIYIIETIENSFHLLKKNNYDS
jgi:uncharacterized membrane protein